jgi:hypothetical protein
MSAKRSTFWYDRVHPGLWWVTVSLVLALVVFVQILQRAQDRSRREMLIKARCSRRLQDIAEGCFLYQDEYGTLPGSFGDLISAGYTDPKATQFRSKWALRSNPPTGGAVFTVPGVGPNVIVRQEGDRPRAHADGPPEGMAGSSLH